MIRRLLPPAFKRSLRLFQRKMRDWKQRHQQPLAGEKGHLAGIEQRIVTQQIKRTHLFENKVHNLQLAARKFENTIIHPGETCSFWHIIGNPSLEKGYKTGRNIVNGHLLESPGGGLCQLSGILYHTALKVGFPITERFNHTVDIYKEQDRFTPLGADATVVYGYKDLRFRNHLSWPIQFCFIIENDTITCCIRSETPVTVQETEFRRTELNGKRVVETLNAMQVVIARSEYRIID